MQGTRENVYGATEQYLTAWLLEDNQCNYDTLRRVGLPCDDRFRGIMHQKFMHQSILVGLM